MRIKTFLNHHGATILSFIAVGGVIATAIQSIRDWEKCKPKIETMKNEETLDKIIVAIPCFIPTISLTAGTTVCILGANALNKRSQTLLISALESLKGHYGLYRQNVIERYGEDVDKEMVSSICRLDSETHFYDIDEPDQKLIFYDDISRQTFEAYERVVMDAEYHFNKNYCLSGLIPYNNFLYLLNIQPMPEGDNIGWSFEDGIVWVDFVHRMEKRDGQNVCVIYTLYPPDEITPEDCDPRLLQGSL